jgi:invasion protein IalB
MHLTRHARFALMICALLPLHTKASEQANEQTQPPATQASALLNTFDVMCNLGPPNFDKLTAQATAMRMRLLDERSETIGAGELMQAKAWVGMLTTGPFALRIDKMSGVKGVVTTCAVDGPVPDVDAFRQSVIVSHRLNPNQPAEMVDGTRTYYWDKFGGTPYTLVLRDMEKPSGHFVQIKLVDMVPAGAK